MRIYLAISEYRKTEEEDDLQDPVIVLLFYGIEYAKKLKRWENEYMIMVTATIYSQNVCCL